MHSSLADIYDINKIINQAYFMQYEPPWLNFHG